MIICDDCTEKVDKDALYSMKGWNGDESDYALCTMCRSYRLAWSVSAIPPGSLAEVENDGGYKITKYKGFERLVKEVTHS